MFDSALAVDAAGFVRSLALRVARSLLEWKKGSEQLVVSPFFYFKEREQGTENGEQCNVIAIPLSKDIFPETKQLFFQH